MQEDRMHSTEETKKSESVLQAEPSIATQGNESALSSHQAKKQGESGAHVRDFHPEDDSFRDFFRTSAAVLPKNMQTKKPVEIKEEKEASAVQENAKQDAPKKEKKPVMSRFLSRVRGVFALPEEDEEDDLLGENLFFPEQTNTWQPAQSAPKATDITPKKSAEHVADQAASSPETLQFDLFAGIQTEESHLNTTEKTDTPAAKPRGKVRFVDPEAAKPVVQKKTHQSQEPEAELALQEKAVVQEAKRAVEKPTKSAVQSAPVVQDIAAQLEEQAVATTPVVPQQDPTEALIASLLQEGRATQKTAQAMPVVVPPEIVTSETVQPEGAEHAEIAPQPEEKPFEDLSEEAAFLLETCEQRTEPRENIATKALAKLSGWKENVVAAYNARKQAQALTASQQVEDDAPLTEDEFFASFVTEQAPDVAVNVQEAPALQVDVAQSTTKAEDAAPETLEEVSTEATVEAFEEATAKAITEIPAEAISPEEEESFDLMFSAVQGAFARRAAQGQSGGPVSVTAAEDVLISPVELEKAAQAPSDELPISDSAQAEQNSSQQAAFVPVPELEEHLLIPEPVVQVAPVVEPEPLLAMEQAVAAEQEPAVETERDLALEPVMETEALPEAELALVTEEPEAALEPTAPVHRDYCLFDQAADEAAAEAQIGEITFVGAAGLSGAVPLTSAPAAEQVSDFFAVLEDEFPADEAHPTAQGIAPEKAQRSAVEETLFELGFGEQAVEQDNAPFEDAPARATKESAHQALPQDPEGIEFGLSGMRMRLLIRTFTTAVFAVALFMLGLMGQGVLVSVDAIDPTSAPVPFLLVNLALLLAAAGVSYPVFIDGVTGLWKKPSPDTLPALATLAALLQLLLCLTLVEQFDPSTTTLFAALAGVALFADALGSLVMAQVIRDNFNLCTAGVPHYLAYRVAVKDTVRTLTRELTMDDPALLVSRPVQQMESFLEKSFSPRASDRRAQWVAYGLLGAALLSGLIALITGRGMIGSISNFTAVLCIGVPLSVTLLAALPSVFLQRAAAKVGAVVPGWQSMEALGNINLLAVEAKDLFPPMCAQLHGIKTFQKERVDLAILYATSILIEGCDTLQSLFAGMIEYKKEMLYPVKDLVNRPGEGFIGWCEHYRVILGTRALMQAEGVELPLMDYENRYSKDGQRQVLYLAVSGQLYAMFLIGYRGEKNIARALRVLRKEHIRLLVHSTDPTLTAARMEQAYRLPAGYITLLSGNQGQALETATDYRPQADGCMLHLGNFASVVGGLKAASGAVQAERSASAIQLIWAGFSILLSLFLSITGGLMEVALVAILLYQIAWSVLCLGVVLTKKFD